jgi:hypothetical protein
MPGTYTVDIPIGYYTHVAGLGQTNDQVTMTGGPIVENGNVDFKIGALNNFWRSCENMTVNPTKQTYLSNTTMIYAVSQACSLRSVNIYGDLLLSEMTGTNMGYSSGGFMANCKISGTLAMGSQQQFICRNTEYETFPNISWNHVNVGCTSISTPPQDARKGCCINTPTAVSKTSNLTVVENTPKVYEKPYLASVNPTNPNDRNSIIQSIVVICPKLSTILSGTTTNTDNTTSISSTNYRIVNDTITGASLNTILANPAIQCVIFSPGRYTIETSIKLSGQLLFGLGLPILRSGNNNPIVVGYGSICGIIFDAGSGVNGTNTTLVSLYYNLPSYLWDIYCRVGGGTNNSDVYSIDTMLYIGGDNSILDNVWCWVADHYADDNSPVGNKALCNIGLYVSGKDVIAYGLFCEHNSSRNVLWNGDGGQVYMFQSEFNYYMSTVPEDLVSYEIDQKVSKHLLYGAGAYSYFANKPVSGPLMGPMAKAGFSWSNNATVDYQNLVTVFLNGYGGISRVFNDVGVPVTRGVQAPIPP